MFSGYINLSLYQLTFLHIAAMQKFLFSKVCKYIIIINIIIIIIITITTVI